MQRTFDAAFRSNSAAEYRHEQEQVCFGALYDGAVLPTSGTEPLQDQCDEAEGFVIFEIQKKNGNHVVRRVSDSSEFGLLDIKSSKTLQFLESIQLIRFQAAVEASCLSKRKKKTRAKPTPISLSINLYGSKSTSDELVTRLSLAKAFLQHPKTISPGITYHNPHFLEFPDDEIKMEAFVGITNDTLSTQRAKLSDEISTILDSLAYDASEMELDFDKPAGLLSTLKSHQHQGVRFILQRESHLDTSAPPFMENGMISTSSYGGILADVMGLGKTLTMLTAILRSLPDAKVFSEFAMESQEWSNTRASATLVVASSAQLLENWQSEISRHFFPGSLNSVVFHGPKRCRDPDVLASADIVLTTYATIAAEDKSQKILQGLAWFRVVLDEAHWIRNSTSKQFKAVAKLATRNRWCLTGTPIQNRLDDLASLAAFLQIPPYSTKASFQKHILDPLLQGGKDFSRPLRAWLRDFCIRRTEKLLQLPDSNEHVVLVAFSPAEARLYDQVLQQTKREIDDIVSQDKSIKKYNILFTSILRMRMLCNTGTFPKASVTKTQLGGKRKKDSGCERCTASNDEDEYFLLMAFQFCPDCGRSLQIASPCPEIGLSPGGRSPQPALSPTPEAGPMSDGFSGKLNAVINKIMAAEDGSKHIVFSYWTSTLDLLSDLLITAGIAHARVDGRTSYAERTRQLNDFRDNGQTHVLVMSIETGALGLNLTVANHVHIVEPQWNPSVEEQAIARAVRMGQTREVTIFRYMVEKTVEQNIVSLQKKKKAAAKFMFNLDAAAELDGKLEDLKFVLDLTSSQNP